MADPDVSHPLEESSGGVRSPRMRKLARDGKSWTPTEQRLRDKLMKQFCHLEGAAGATEAYRRGWDAAFGSPEVKARAVAEFEAAKTVTLKDGSTLTIQGDRVTQTDAQGNAATAPLSLLDECGISGTIEAAKEET